MKRKKMFPFILLFLFLGSISLQGQGFVLQKDVFVAEGEIQDSVLSFGGNILIKGKVRQNVVAFGGQITIEGEVGESILGFGSEVTIKSSAEVNGDVVSIGGTLDKEFGALIKGDTIHFDFAKSGDFQRFLKEGLFGVFGMSLIPLFLIIKLITLFIWFVLGIVLAAIFPHQLSLASSQIRKSFWPVFGTGLLSIIIFTILIIFAVLLSFILVGIPILVLLIILGMVIKFFGRVILFYFFGDSLSRAFGNKQTSPILAVILGFFLVSLISLIPIIGSPLFTSILSIIGWGVVIRTKFGTTENWFRKK